MPKFLRRYCTNLQCLTALEAARWSDGFARPSCGGHARTNFVREALRDGEEGRMPRPPVQTGLRGHLRAPKATLMH